MAEQQTQITGARMRWGDWLIRVVLATLILAVLCLIFPVRRFVTDLLRPAPAVLSRSFDGSSNELARTQIVPTLDTPMEQGKNVIWCASFQVAWKELAKGLDGGALGTAGTDSAWGRLNGAADVLDDLPEGSYFAAGGAVNQGILGVIQEQMRARFPDVPAPRFDNIPLYWNVGYAYLQTHARFTIPYFENGQPLEFVDSSDRTTRIRSFGVRKEDEYAYYSLRKQVAVLYAPPGLGMVPGSEFALDLCRTSEPVQVVIAKLQPLRTLAETVSKVQAAAASAKQRASKEEGLGPNDTLLVPDIFWRISHRFGELETEPIHVAAQDITFRLDRNGAELRSEAKVIMCPIASHFTFDGPFLLYMKKRTVERPFFVMWVDNAELLQKWPGAK